MNKSTVGNKAKLIETILGSVVPKPPSKKEAQQHQQQVDLTGWTAPTHGFDLPTLPTFDYLSVGLKEETKRLVDIRVNKHF